MSAASLRMVAAAFRAAAEEAEAQACTGGAEFVEAESSKNPRSGQTREARLLRISQDLQECEEKWPPAEQERSRSCSRSIKPRSSNRKQHRHRKRVHKREARSPTPAEEAEEGYEHSPEPNQQNAEPLEMQEVQYFSPRSVHGQASAPALSSKWIPMPPPPPSRTQLAQPTRAPSSTRMPPPPPMPQLRVKPDDLHECDILVDSESDGQDDEADAETEVDSEATEKPKQRLQKIMPLEGTVIVAPGYSPETVSLPDANRRYRLSKKLTKFLRYTSAGARLYADGSIWSNNLAQVTHEDEGVVVAVVKGDRGKHFDYIETGCGLRIRAKAKHAHEDVVDQLLRVPMEPEPVWKANEDYSEGAKRQRNWEAKQRKKIRRENDYIPVSPKLLRPPRQQIDDAEL